MTLTVTVRFMGPLKNKVGRPVEELVFEDDATVGDVLRRFSPVAGSALSVMVKNKAARPSEKLRDGDTVYLIEPIRGG